MQHTCLPNVSPKHVIRPIGGFKLVINLPGLVLAVAIVAKCKEIINLAQKILIWRQLLAEKKIAGENFYLALECHLEKVIDSCCPCIS